MMVVFLHYSREIILECPLFVVKQLQLLGTLSAHEKLKQMSRLSKMHLVQFITKDVEENTLVFIWKKSIEIKFKYQQQGLFKSFLSVEQVRHISGPKEC